MEGIIIKNISNDYTVRTNNNDLVVCKPRGKFRNSKLSKQYVFNHNPMCMSILLQMIFDRK